MLRSLRVKGLLSLRTISEERERKERERQERERQERERQERRRERRSRRRREAESRARQETDACLRTRPAALRDAANRNADDAAEAVTPPAMTGRERTPTPYERRNASESTSSSK